MLREHLTGELDAQLGARLVILDHEVDRASLDAVLRIHEAFLSLKRLPFRLPQECRATGQGQDDIDLVRRGG